MESVFLAIPTYDGKIDGGVMGGVLSASKRRRVIPASKSHSLLGSCFNLLWIGGTLSGADYFAMLHADITPDPLWIDTLIDELEDTDSDILSATVRIKNDTGEYSVGLGYAGQPCHYRLTKQHFDALPLTFDSEDVRNVTGHEGDLLVNTGCWICRTGDWVRQVSFNVTTWIDWTCDPPRAESIPEDWGFSHQAHRLGLKVRGTKVVGTVHHGRLDYHQPAKRCEPQRQTPQKSTPLSPDVTLQQEVIHEHLQRKGRNRRKASRKRR